MDPSEGDVVGCRAAWGGGHQSAFKASIQYLKLIPSTNPKVGLKNSLVLRKIGTLPATSKPLFNLFALC